MSNASQKYQRTQAKGGAVYAMDRAKEDKNRKEKPVFLIMRGRKSEGKYLALVFSALYYGRCVEYRHYGVIVPINPSIWGGTCV